MICKLRCLSISSLKNSLVHRHYLELRLLNLILLIDIPKWGVHNFTSLPFMVLETASCSRHRDSTLILFLYYVRTWRQLNECLACWRLRSLIVLIYISVTFLKTTRLYSRGSFRIRQIPHKSMRCWRSWMLFVFLFFDSKTDLDGSTIRTSFRWT